MFSVYFIKVMQDKMDKEYIVCQFSLQFALANLSLAMSLRKYIDDKNIAEKLDNFTGLESNFEYRKDEINKNWIKCVFQFSALAIH